jgi:hypothetical protein
VEEANSYLRGYVRDAKGDILFHGNHMGASAALLRAQETPISGVHDLPIPEVPPNAKEVYDRYMRVVREQPRPERLKGRTLAEGNEVGKAAVEQMKPREAYQSVKEAERLVFEFDQNYEQGFQRWLDERIKELMSLEDELGIYNDPEI